MSRLLSVWQKIEDIHWPACCTLIDVRQNEQAHIPQPDLVLKPGMHLYVYALPKDGTKLLHLGLVNYEVSIMTETIWHQQTIDSYLQALGEANTDPAGGAQAALLGAQACAMLPWSFGSLYPTKNMLRFMNGPGYGWMASPHHRKLCLILCRKMYVP